jgi:hypothetical protein
MFFLLNVHLLSLFKYVFIYYVLTLLLWQGNGGNEWIRGKMKMFVVWCSRMGFLCSFFIYQSTDRCYLFICRLWRANERTHSHSHEWVVNEDIWNLSPKYGFFTGFFCFILGRQISSIGFFIFICLFSNNYIIDGFYEVRTRQYIDILTRICIDLLMIM